MDNEDEEIKQMIEDSCPVARQVINLTSTLHEKPAIQALGMLGGAIALTKRDGCVGKQEFLAMASAIWDVQTASWTPIERNKEKLN